MAFIANKSGDWNNYCQYSTLICYRNAKIYIEFIKILFELKLERRL